MQFIGRVRAVLFMAALALLLALPSAAFAKSNHGNHCGRHHAKHTRAVGKSCSKHRKHASASTVRSQGQPATTQDDPADANDNDQADDQNEATEDQNEQADDQNEAANDQGDDQDEAGS